MKYIDQDAPVVHAYYHGYRACPTLSKHPRVGVKVVALDAVITCMFCAAYIPASNPRG